MAKGAIKLVLSKERTIGGTKRKPGFVLLEGTLPANVSQDDINKVIQLREVSVAAQEDKPADKK